MCIRDSTGSECLVASAYCIQQAEKCREEAARARDDDIKAYWKEAERCWLALVQDNEAQPWPFVSKETEKVRLRFSLGQSDHVTVVVLSLIHISEPTRLLSISYAVFCLK